MTTEEIDHHDTPDIVCPWCGHHNDDADFGRGGPSEQWNCEDCGKPFQIEADYSVTYSTEKVLRSPPNP